MLLSKLNLAAAAVALPSVLGHVAKRQGLPVDPNTTKYCSWYADVSEGETCRDVLNTFEISMADFVRWNPSLSSTCGGFKSGVSYCVEAYGEPPVTTTQPPTTAPPSTTSKPTTTTMPTTTSTTTKPGNGIETPAPVQDGMATNCNRFALVASGDTCAKLASANGISTADFIKFNPAAGSDCTGLWADYYVCVGVIGGTTIKPTSTTSQTTTTKPTNGITTPTPIQDGMTGSCNKFHLVQSGEGCVGIASKNGIPVAKFYEWNPSAKTDCSGLWADTYACVSTIGYTPPTSTTAKPSTTQPTNGVSTPTPVREGMTSSCNKFVMVKSGDQCGTIASKAGIPLAKLYEWNPSVNTDCSGLWAEYYICTGVIGYTPPTTTTQPPTTTKPGNGITTPTPFIDTMYNTCKKFYKVVSNDTCDKIVSKTGVTKANFTKWNPAVGSTCNVWLDYNYCVGV